MTDPSPEAMRATRRIAAECRKWTKRADDAKRIPDAMFDFAPRIIDEEMEPMRIALKAVAAGELRRMREAIEMYVTCRREGPIQSGSPPSEYHAFLMMCEIIDGTPAKEASE